MRLFIPNLYLHAKIKNTNYIHSINLISLFILFACILALVLHPSFYNDISRFTSSIIELVQILIMISAYNNYQAASKKEQSIFLWFLLAFIGLVVNRIAFYTVVYVLKYPIGHMSFSAFICYVIPFLFWLISITIFLLKLLVPNVFNVKSLIKTLSLFISFNIPIIVIFFSAIMNTTNGVSGVLFLSALIVIYKLILFDFLILGLIYADNINILLILTGIAIITASGTFLNYAALSTTSNLLVYVELSWLLGTIVICYGAQLFLLTKRDTLEDCFRKTNTIKSRIVFWTFCLSIVSFIIFFVVAYLFSFINKVIFAGLPSFIMIYSVLVVLLSIYIGRYFELPFKKILNNIHIFMINKNKEKLDNNFYIEEFILLQNFITNTFEINEEKNRIKKELEEISAQVAHDIRSPLAALEIVIKRLPEIEDFKRIMLGDAVNQIRDIINNLEKNITSSCSNNDMSVTQVAVLLDFILSERRVAFSNKSIKFDYDFISDCYNLFVEVNVSEMKRVLTNIINNACEAVMLEGGIVRVDIVQESNSVVISINDNGPYINKEVQASFFTRGFTTKSNGSGLGLFYAKDRLTKWSGNIELIPDKTRGMTANIKLPLKDPLPWFVSVLSIPANSTVVCVDDSISIWHAWVERFKIVNGNIRLLYCSSKLDLLRVISGQCNDFKTYLVDYEFSSSDYTGIDLVNLILSSLKSRDRIFLVTSHSNDEAIQEFCKLNGIHMIPKHFAFKMTIRITTNSIKAIILIDRSDYYDIENIFLPLIDDILIYHNLNEFLMDLILFENEVTVYIHQNHAHSSKYEAIENSGFKIFTFNKEDIRDKLENAQ